MCTRARLLPAVLAAAFLAAGAAGCGGARGGGDELAAGTEPAGTEAAGAALDGEGMEPRIVVEHPVDAPGRPGDGRAAPLAPPEPAAAWVPHLPVADLEASLGFYRELGFTVVSRRPEEGAAGRVELEHDGARLVLVAAAADAEGEAAEDGDAAGAAVLHLVATPTAAARTGTDPDGHRLALPAAP